MGTLLEPIQEIYQVVRDILVFDDHTEGQVSQTTPGLVAKLAISDGYADS
jgi:hypothetical protein